MRFAFLGLVSCCIGLCACGRWNADKHFEHEKLIRDNKLHEAALLRTKEAEANIKQLRNSAITRVRRGMNAAELQAIAGYRFDPLAQISSGNEIWERRRYLLAHVVASRWGSFSPESKLCDKEAELFTITLVDGVVRDIDSGY